MQINIYETGYATKADADAMADAIMRQWPPQGYSTFVSVYQDKDTGNWTIYGSRSSSAD